MSRLVTGWLALVAIATSAQAARIDFRASTLDGRASLATRLIATRDAVAPVELRLTVPSIDVTAMDDGFSDVRVPGLVPFTTPGNPELAGTGALIAVPAGFEPVLSVERQVDDTVADVLARPAQRRWRCGSPRDEAFAFNRGIYDSTSAFPAEVASLEEVGNLQGLRLVRVALNPVRQVPGRRVLHVTTEMVVRVAFRQTDAAQPVVLSRPMYELARSVVANANGLGAQVRASGAPEVMLVVTAEPLKSAIEPLLRWKREKGISTVVYTTQEAGGTKEAIKKFIKAQYDKASVKPSYLLFVGNKDSAPGFMESTASGSAATDWTYTLLSGDDNIPDVFYGRILANDAAEAETQVQRLVALEKSPEHADWYTFATTIASNEGSNPSDKEYAQQVAAALKAGTYTKVDGFYQADKTATAANITQALVEGRSWLAYFGHGSGTSWGSTNDTFNNTTVSSLTNADRLPVIIDVACQNGSWAKIAKPFGKAWVTHRSGNRPAGAVAFYGGSVNISWHEPAVMSVGIAKYHFEKKIRSLGGSVLAGQLYLFEKMGTGNNTMDNLKWYNLFGEPSLELRTSMPASYEVNRYTRLVAGGFEVSVNVVGKDGQPLSGVAASIAAPNGSEVAVATTDSEGNATLRLSGNLESGTILTTTGYNLETQQIGL